MVYTHEYIHVRLVIVYPHEYIFMRVLECECVCVRYKTQLREYARQSHEYARQSHEYTRQVGEYTRDVRLACLVYPWGYRLEKGRVSHSHTCAHRTLTHGEKRLTPLRSLSPSHPHLTLTHFPLSAQEHTPHAHMTRSRLTLTHSCISQTHTHTRMHTRAYVKYVKGVYTHIYTKNIQKIYIYMQIYIYIHTYVNTHTHTYISLCVFVWLYLYTYIYVCVYTYIYVYVNTQTHKRTQTQKFYFRHSEKREKLLQLL